MVGEHEQIDWATPVGAGGRIELPVLSLKGNSHSSCGSGGCGSGGCGCGSGTTALRRLDERNARWGLGARERDLSRPFVRRFRTDNHHYVYDVNTNRVVEVSEAVYEVIDDFGALPAEDLIAKHRDRLAPAEIRAALAEIERARAESGLFSNNHATEILHPLDEQSLRLLYDEEVPFLCLGVTEQCNLRCTYCAFTGTYKYNREHNDTDMSFEVARRAIDFLREHSTLAETVGIGFYGGEPLLKADLIRACIDYARSVFGRRQLAFAMTTNATLLSEQNCKLLVDNDFELLVSIDGPRELHDRQRVNRGGRGTFRAIERNLARLKRMDPDYYQNVVRFNMVLAPPYDFESLDRFVTESPIADVDHVRTAYVSQRDTTFFDRFTDDELSGRAGLDKIREKSDEALAEARFGGIRPPRDLMLARGMFWEGLEVTAKRLQAIAPALPPIFHPGGICLPGMRKLFVTPAGRFFTCEKSSTASDLLSIGSIGPGVDVRKIADNIDSYTRAHDGCRYCYASRHCGTCFVGAYSDGRFDHDTKVARCNAHRREFEETLGTIMSVLERNPRAFDHVKDMVVA